MTTKLLAPYENVIFFYCFKFFPSAVNSSKEFLIQLFQKLQFYFGTFVIFFLWTQKQNDFIKTKQLQNQNLSRLFFKVSVLQKQLFWGLPHK